MATAAIINFTGYIFSRGGIVFNGEVILQGKHATLMFHLAAATALPVCIQRPGRGDPVGILQKKCLNNHVTDNMLI